MSNKRIMLTAAGVKKLEKELAHLKHEERPKIIKSISDAREMGDLSENAEYHSAREKQSLIESRIQTLEAVLSQAEVFDSSHFDDDVVRFGAKVLLLDTDLDKELNFQIVGEYESSIEDGLISNSSPLGRSLLTKKIGDEVSLSLPTGNKTYEILEVSYKQT